MEMFQTRYIYTVYVHVHENLIQYTYSVYYGLNSTREGVVRVVILCSFVCLFVCLFCFVVVAIHIYFSRICFFRNYILLHRSICFLGVCFGIFGIHVDFFACYVALSILITQYGSTVYRIAMGGPAL